MDIKKIMDKFEPEFVKDENSRLPQELFAEGAGNSLVEGKKLKTLSLKEVSLIKGPDFEKFSKADQDIAMKIAEWWFDKFYATIKKPIVVPVEKTKASKIVNIKPIKPDIKKDVTTMIAGTSKTATVTSRSISESVDDLDFYKDLKDSPVKSIEDLKKKR
ncbi:MAG: hypothetical protein LBN07_00025 [Christensenellaceae bacterium]|nr:hypothetical protein [Christensenellaceae bacterium]